ncbi:hypothetical protein E3O25_08500 [Cryobacterium sp. TMT1-3]|uniref:DUF2269 family protein n=1 Tax=Cryobacterium luteum TaxID=1424661 RepID=A0A1H8IPE0_9MICO|nr:MULTISPECIES: hypothetical protein [Cryobacterium]TFB91107.1 hypothetical protein E3O10_06790 [Cryobacterium luteum]TFC28180.1 hypothetical protein E3O25_08500 [Cryobacterium sp. TMT1-3]SEN70780.1 hypothetical protein SAMN05216281_11219 [Cryobacterium luteum]
MNIDWEFNGLPLHVLIVHAVVIVVPLAALCAVLTAFWPAARRRLGVVTPLVALAALVLVPMAVQAGEWLQSRLVNVTPLLGTHTSLGKTMLPWVIVLFLAAALQWFWYRYVEAEGARFSSAVPSHRGRLVATIVLDLVILAGAIGSVVLVALIGESGSRAVWTGLFTS